jgi:hypothetical protein
VALLELIAHELVHSQQCERLGGMSNFGYEYFREYKRANQNYRNNRLEIEAYDLVARINLPLQVATEQRCGQEGNIEVRVGSSNLDFRPGQRWVTCTGYTFIFQSDGNLVHYNPSGQAIWATNTHDQGAEVLAMQADGNLVIYGSGGRIFWTSNTHNNPGAFLAIQQDGNVVIYNNRGQALWATGTNGR